jgi:hypothetical protein
METRETPHEHWRIDAQRFSPMFPDIPSVSPIISQRFSQRSNYVCGSIRRTYPFGRDRGSRRAGARRPHVSGRLGGSFPHVESNPAHPAAPRKYTDQSMKEVSPAMPRGSMAVDRRTQGANCLASPFIHLNSSGVEYGGHDRFPWIGRLAGLNIPDLVLLAIFSPVPGVFDKIFHNTD